MRSTFYLGLALFSTYASAAAPSPTPTATTDGVDTNKIIDELNGLASSVLADPAVSSDLADLEAAIPTSLIPAVESVIPQIESDVISYAASLIDTPSFTSVINALESAIPSDVQDQISSDPSDFIISLITESSYPSWVSAIPTSVANYIVSVADHVVSIGSADLAKVLPTGILDGETTGLSTASAKATVTSATARATATISGGKPTGTGAGGSNTSKSTPKSTASPIPFVNAAPLMSGVAGTALMLVGAGAWLLA